MTTFVDTSAFFALLDEGDAGHRRAADWLRRHGADPDEVLATTSYVIVESIALVRSRLGVAAVRTFVDRHLPAISTVFVDGPLHRIGLDSYLASTRTSDSFVDHVSFAFMRGSGIRRAFAFDRDFARQGFDVVP